MLKEMRSAATCCVILAALLVGGCAGEFLQAERVSEVLERPEIPQITTVDVSPNSITLTITPSFGKPYTIRIIQSTAQSGEKHLTVLVGGTEIPDLAGTRLDQLREQQLDGKQLQAQALPLTLGLAVAVFVAGCASELYDSYQAAGFNYKKLDLGRASTACIATGAGALAGTLTALGVRNPAAAIVIETTVRVVVTELIKAFAPSAWSSLTSLYNAFKAQYIKISSVIREALCELGVLPDCPPIPTILTITNIQQDRPGSLEVGAGVFIGSCRV